MKLYSGRARWNPWSQRSMAPRILASTRSANDWVRFERNLTRVSEETVRVRRSRLSPLSKRCELMERLKEAGVGLLRDVCVGPCTVPQVGPSLRALWPVVHRVVPLHRGYHAAGPAHFTRVEIPRPPWPRLYHGLCCHHSFVSLTDVSR